MILQSVYSLIGRLSKNNNLREALINTFLRMWIAFQRIDFIAPVDRGWLLILLLLDFCLLICYAVTQTVVLLFREKRGIYNE